MSGRDGGRSVVPVVCTDVGWRRRWRSTWNNCRARSFIKRAHGVKSGKILRRSRGSVSSESLESRGKWSNESSWEKLLKVSPNIQWVAVGNARLSNPTSEKRRFAVKLFLWFISGAASNKFHSTRLPQSDQSDLVVSLVRLHCNWRWSWLMKNKLNFGTFRRTISD